MKKLSKLNELVTTAFRRKHIIVLNPEEQFEKTEKLNANMIYDKAKWNVPEKIRALVDELSENRQLSDEEKILKIYEELCKSYVYDDNVISYIRKVDDESYSLPDFYGREVDEEWEKNRQKHNRRVCYEVSRYLAQALKELFKNNEKYDICILWDKGLTHYFVGLTCDEYSATLDIDDFNNIKDLTRLKAGLTVEGIRILQDDTGKLRQALSKFNEGKWKEAIEQAENTTTIKSENENPINESEDIAFLQYVIEVLKHETNIDSQGLYEYMKEIVDIKVGPQARKKVWKQINRKDDEEIRYTRCLILDIDGKKYIIDVDQMLLRQFDESELGREFIPYKDLLSEELIDYRCRKENRYIGG